MRMKFLPLSFSVHAARLCKALQLADFIAILMGCGGPYSQLFHSFCGSEKGAIKARVRSLRALEGLDSCSILQPKNELETRPKVIDGTNLYINQARCQTDCPNLCF